MLACDGELRLVRNLRPWSNGVACDERQNKGHKFWYTNASEGPIWLYKNIEMN